MLVMLKLGNLCKNMLAHALPCIAATQVEVQVGRSGHVRVCTQTFPPSTKLNERLHPKTELNEAPHVDTIWDWHN